VQIGRIAVAAVFGAGLALALAAMPKRYEVAGISMAPGLLPGDVVTTGWLPFADRWREPRRWDRWVARLPDGSTGVKRLAGIAGETVSIEEGDLAIDGEIVLKDPHTLAEIGSIVSPPISAAMPTSWSWPPTRVLDEAPFAADEPSRRLLPVRDVGFAAVVRVTGTGGARARSRCGPLAVTWRLGQSDRYAIVTGRLDGRAVAAAWRVPEAMAVPWRSRSCLPVDWPRQWTVAEAWPAAADRQATQSPALALDLAAPEAGASAVIEQVAVWRDVLYRPPATGTTTWHTEPGSGLLLGDFPPASRDSRHFGTLPTSALRHRIHPRP
jgi:type IV secretory pathway protease TraF